MPMFKRLRAFEAPSYYVFKDPDTAFVYTARSREELVRSILSYREQNNLPPIEALNVVLENYWCGLPENNGKCQEHTTLNRSLMGYIRGGIALLQNMAFPSFATQDEADVRSEQCANCPYNSFPDRGPFLKWSDEVAVSCVGERKSKRHNDLGNCSVCTCPLRSKVFWNKPLEKFDDEQLVQLRKVNCWQLKLSGQDKV